MKAKIKYEYEDCPICRKNKDVISDGNSFGSGVVGIAGKGMSGEGCSIDRYYCTKCYVKFEIRITYTKYAKSQAKNGWTGETG